MMYKLMDWLRVRREKLAMRIAWILPRWLAAQAFNRVVAHATTGKYLKTNVPDLTAVEAFRRWPK
jgi:hypothetical protein